MDIAVACYEEFLVFVKVYASASNLCSCSRGVGGVGGSSSGSSDSSSSRFSSSSSSSKVVVALQKVADVVAVNSRLVSGKARLPRILRAQLPAQQ